MNHFTDIPRDPADGALKTVGQWPAHLLPRLSPDGVINQPVRGLLQTKFGKSSLQSKGGARKSMWRRKASRYMCTSIGLSLKNSERLFSRSEKQLSAIFNNFDSLIDCLLLCSPELFDPYREHSVIIKFTRNYFKIATYNVQQTSKMFKQLANSLFTVLTESVTEQEVSLRLKGNAFRCLLDSDYISGLISNLKSGKYPSKRDFCRLAHLISTRGFIPGDRKVEAESIRRFKEITSSTFRVSEDCKADFRLAVRRVLHLSEELGGKPGGAHLSLTQSGEIDCPRSLGGKATACIWDMKSFLNEITEEDHIVVYPWGDEIRYRQGQRRWLSIEGKALGNAEKPGPKIFESCQRQILERETLLEGVGDDMGLKVYIVAYHFYQLSNGQIPIRTATVSEAGGKCRIVTTGPWWLSALQTPFMHDSKSILEKHPSAHSSLRRADQTWEALHNLERYGEILLRDEDFVLSSDLKDATDAISHDVVRIVLDEICELPSMRKYSYLKTLPLCRTVLHQDHSITHLTRGVMMGEPLSKIVLTVQNLAVEEMAWQHSHGLKKVQLSGAHGRRRVYHIAGDDHIAIGPMGYLNMITTNHKALGSVISPDKHRISKIAVVYTEKVLYFHNTPIRSFEWTKRNVKDSIFVDSIKVRLLSPFSKASETMNESNVCIGKAKQLGKTLEWFEGTERQYMVQTALSRARYRFRSFLPARHRPKMWSVTALPQSLGGLGLSLESEYEKVCHRLPNIYNWAIRVILREDHSSHLVKRILQSMFVNTATRGVIHLQTIIQRMMDQMNEFPLMSDMLSFNDLKEKFNEKSFYWTTRKAKDNNIVGISGIPGMLERPFMFLELIKGSEVTSGFNTKPVKDRLWLCWHRLEQLRETFFERSYRTGYEYLLEAALESDKVLSLKELKDAQWAARQDKYIDLNQKINIVYEDIKDIFPEQIENQDERLLRLLSNPSNSEEIRIIDLLLMGTPKFNFSATSSNIKDVKLL